MLTPTPLNQPLPGAGQSAEASAPAANLWGDPQLPAGAEAALEPLQALLAGFELAEPLPEPVSAEPLEAALAWAESPPPGLEGTEAWLQQMQAQRSVVLGGADPLGAPRSAPALPTAVAALASRPLSADAMPLPEATPGVAAGKTEAPAPAELPPLEAAPRAINRADALASLSPSSPSALAASLGASEPAAAVASGAPAATPAEPLLRLQAPEARWGEQMMQALRENVALQLKQNVQQTTIRLDPAELGRLEIQVTHEAGRVSVQIHASQADVARLLTQTSERLRQELVSQHFVQVDVQVGAEGGAGRQRSPAQPLPLADETIAAAHEQDTTVDTPALRASRDVLITV